MRITEIANPSALVQAPESGRVASTREEREQIREFLSGRGWNILGVGNFAVVAEKNNQVIKFYKTDTPGFMGDTSNPVEFVRFVASIKNKAIQQHFPKFGPVRTVKVGDSDWIMIPTEKLSPEPTNIPPFDKNTKLGPEYDPENDYWDCREDGRSGKKLFVQKYGSNVWDVYNSNSKAEALIFRHNNNYDDLDMESNIMFRGWIPVINDPWGQN